MKQFSILEDQIRECFGRVVYTHKTHEKMADQCTKRLNRYKIAQIALTALTSSGVLAAVYMPDLWLKLGTAIVSLISLYVTAFMKSFDLGAIAQKHRDAAQKIWGIRESYLSILADLRMGSISDDEGRTRRDRLQDKLGQVYVGAPQTNSKAYISAQEALKELEDYSFSDKEIDSFLPTTLKKPQ